MKVSMVKKYLMLVIALMILFSLNPTIKAQTSEAEPNDDYGQGGIITITANGQYTGSIDDLGDVVDIWYINASSSGIADISYSASGSSANTVLNVYSNASTYGSGTLVQQIAPSGVPASIALSSSLYYSLNATAVNFNDTYTIDISGSASLPVSLISLTAQQLNKVVLLGWTTASELNNIGFILDRKIKDQNDWSEIASYKTHAELKGQGSTSSSTEYEFMDRGVEPSQGYYYRLSDVDMQGEINTYTPIFIQLNQLQEKTLLEKAYPNPFNPRTHIAYHLAQEGEVNIRVFNMLGRSVKVLYEGYQPSGSYHIYWDGTTGEGIRVPSGIYVIRMQTNDTEQRQKVMFIK